MAEHDPDDVTAGWNIVRRAGRAQPQELQSLATQMADLLDRDGIVGAPIARLAACERVVGSLALLAHAAPPGRAAALTRLWGLAAFNRDELDEIEFDVGSDDEDEDDELPA